MQNKEPVVIQFSQVAFSYSTVPVLENVNFHVHRGEFIALVGPNGAGKSTILKLLLGLEQAGKGNIEVLGKEPKESRSHIGYVPQHADFDKSFPISVYEVIRMGRLKPIGRAWNKDDEQAVQKAMEQVEILDLARRPYGALSGGQRRRVLVARALAAEPEILVLDEPTANMDAESEERLFKTLGQLKGKTTILIVTHDTEFVSALTDRVLCIGERTGSERRAHHLVQHRAAPAEHAPPELFGGAALQVLHDEVEPENRCCIDTKEASNE
ncbi:metal ABC transporter ATP-binding protein [Gracilinema caldarium]|uniref:metal ABC transporter ATP-binding protein n=1 Tax=Gracilinema caldarium TaxID=215591 RepID=UPI0026EEAEB5|nr:metal ABC transporter ATP-binding protein [Gracilinema caldarium]